MGLHLGHLSPVSVFLGLRLRTEKHGGQAVALSSIQK
jgi:hypothetical protein